MSRVLVLRSEGEGEAGAVAGGTKMESEEPDGGGADKPLLDPEAGEVTSCDQAAAQPCMEEADDGIPYDKGWAWMIVCSSFLHFAVFIGFLKSCGVIFVELLGRFQAPATQTTLIFGIRSGVYSVTGLYVMNVVVSRLGVRKTVLVGSVLVSLSTILASLTSDLISLIGVHSVLIGMGSAMLVPPGMVLIGSYFRRHRSLAIAIAKCGGSVGGMTMPLLVTYLLSEYGLRGALLLTGGIFLHSIPAALLLRPTSFYTKRQRTQSAKAAACRQPQEPVTARRAGGARSQEDVAAGSAGEQKEFAGGTDKVVSPLMDSSDVNVHPTLTASNSDRLDSCLPLLLSTQNDILPVNGPQQETVCALHGRRFVCRPKGSDRNETCSRCITTLQVARISKSSQEFSRRPFAHENAFPLRRAISGFVPYEAFTFLGKLCANGKADTVGSWTDSENTCGSVSVSSPTSTTAGETGHADCGDRRQSAACRPQVAEQHSAEKNLGRLYGSDMQSLEQTPRVDKNGDDNEQTHRRDMQSVEKGSQQSVEKGSQSSSTQARTCRAPRCVNAAVFMLDFSLLRSGLFRLLLLHVVLAGFVYNVTDYLPAVAAEKGLSRPEAALLLTIIGGLDFVCRLLSGVIADMKVVRVSTMVVISLAIVGVTAQFVRFMTSFPLFALLAVVHGLVGGVFGCLMPILIIDFVGLDNMSKGYGFCQLVSGATLAAIYPMLGFVRDSTGSYAAVYHVIGCGLLGAAALLCCEGAVRRREETRKAETDGGD